MSDVEAQLIHDLRNTATVIRTAAMQLSADPESMPRHTMVHLAHMITRRSDMFLRLLGDLSMLAELDGDELTVSLQRTCLVEICEFALANRTLAPGKTLIVDVDADACVVSDPLRLTQILDNLLTNALRYGGPNVTVRSVCDQGVVRLEVADDGEGVPPEIVPHLFHGYIRGESSYLQGGAGLGLSIVHSLCTAIGATVEYHAGHGSHFTVTLPAAPAVVAAQTPQSPAARVPRPKGAAARTVTPTAAAPASG